MEYRVQYQRWNEESGRPNDYAMNNRELNFTEAVVLPNVGDHILFSNEKDGEVGCWRVRSRLFSHWYDTTQHDWVMLINIVLEESHDGRALLAQ